MERDIPQDIRRLKRGARDGGAPEVLVPQRAALRGREAAWARQLSAGPVPEGSPQNNHVSPHAAVLLPHALQAPEVNQSQTPTAWKE